MGFTVFSSKKKQKYTELEPVNTVIIGAGPSGLSAASTLKDKGKKILILEKESVVGGKCHTYSDPKNPSNKTEWGAALLASNYGKVIDKMEEKNISWEATLPADTSTVPLIQAINRMSLLQKGAFGIQFIKQMTSLALHANEYQRLRDAHQDLPEDYKLPFAEFSKKYHLEYINDFSYLFVPAFGYGLMEQCPAYAIFEYYGMMTLPSIGLADIMGTNSLLSVKNGFQGLMESIAGDFNIQLNTIIESIERNEKGIHIHFETNNQFFSVRAESLVLAISPLYWPKLGMQLSQTEQQCVDNLIWYQYPVAVVKLKGYPAKHYFEYKGLIESGLGHLALITTRDDRENPADGRLCTAYINLKHQSPDLLSPFVFTSENIKQLENELLQIPDVNGVEIIEKKVWQDYMSTLPWETRLALDKKQMAPETNTLYVGPYALGGFEDVACVWEQADKAATEFILEQKPEYGLSYYRKELHRASFFFSAPKAAPFNQQETIWAPELH